MHQSVKYCGGDLPSAFDSSGESLEIRFKSDADGSGDGFKVAYSLLGCNQTYSTASGRIISPNWPSSSPQGTVCEFVISVGDSRSISVYSRFFTIRSDANCSTAYLEVRIIQTGTF